MQRRALIVDDEVEMCNLFESVLNATGMEVVCLTKSTDAVGYLQGEKFDVILMDLRMPTPDGVALARLTRGSGFNRMTPIIMISDDQHIGVVAEGFEAGASFFLYKPIDKKKLLQLVRATQGAIEHERRRFRRVLIQAKVQLISDSGECEGETIDISLNGMMVRAPKIVPRGSFVRFSLFLLAGTKPVVGSGSVMRVIGANQMGIQLDRLNVAESARLQEFLLPLILHE
jgi:two-component system, chemotaxis family, chemotaxis protein CheY